ncbi:hypothetical protein MXD81_25210, partial [Microbacteriaceae bacterium K1510]|nr:hypothetical protein [Microbacteriaceae bacterium K1510]
MLDSSSSAAGQRAIAAALAQLEQTVNDTELDSSPAALLQKFNDALQRYASSPDSLSTGQAAVAAARNVVTSLHEATNII